MMTRKLLWLCLVAIATIVLLTYAPALKLNFYADDYSFVEIAGRSSLVQYLAFYFDPSAQTGWYRPMQGMLFGVEYVLFGGNPLGYHLVNVLVHLVNCLLLFTLVWRVVKRWRVALIATLIYAGLSLYSVAVFWPGDADFLLTFFYLLSILFWVLFLQEGKRTPYFAAVVAFLLALLTKEFGVTLPVMLFLVDRLLLPRKVIWAELTRRYAPFLFVWAIYLPMEYSIQSRSVLTNLYGYGFGFHTFSNLIQYLAWLAFPWGLPDPANFVWLATVAVAFLLAVAVKRNGSLLFLGVASVLSFLPVISFPWFSTRYLYMSAMAPVIAFAFLFEHAWGRFVNRKWFTIAVMAGVALIVFVNSRGIASATSDFAEIGRQTRVPFRDITQRHATFPNDTYLYFIDPPTITSQLSGMFFLRYGAGISVSSNEHGGQRANLRDHANAYVVYFDEQQHTRETSVANEALGSSSPTDFDAPIQLLGYEMPSAQAKRGGVFVLVLYWQATQSLSQDYAVTLRLVDTSTGSAVASQESEPRDGKAPTSSWKPGELVVDARIFSIGDSVPVGNTYRFELGLRNISTGQLVALRDPPGARFSVIAPINIVE